jgi:hypothetical protein
MIDERAQLAMVGGQGAQIPAAAAPAELGASLWIQSHVTPASMLAFADRHRRALWITVLFFYLAAFNGQWRVQPDAAYYLSIGRNLAEGKGFTYLGIPDHLAYPGWPGLIAITFRIFGSHSLLSVNVVMLMISLATVSMVYRLFLLHSGRPTAVAMSVGVGLTKAFFCYGFELWSDMPFALGAMAALAGYEGLFGNSFARSTRQRRIDAVFFIGGLLLAASMRPTIWPLLAAIALSIAFQTVRRQISWRVFTIIASISILLAGIVITIAWMRTGMHGFGGVYEDYLLNRFRGTTPDNNVHPFTDNIRDLFTLAASDVLFQTRLGPTCNTLLSLGVIALGFSLFRYRVLWGFWFTLLLAIILVSQETLDRYFLPVLPLLVYSWWMFMCWIYRNLKEAPLSLPPWSASVAFAGLMLFGTLMNLTKVGGIIMQQRERPFLASYDKGTFDVAPQFAKLLHDRVGDKAIVLAKAPYGRVTAFLSDRYVTSSSAVTIGQTQTHNIYVIDPSDLATQNLLRTAGLTEGPALFTVIPSANHGEKAVALSLHATHRRQ